MDRIGDGLLDDIKVNVELVAVNGFDKGEGPVGHGDAVALVEVDLE